MRGAWLAVSLVVAVGLKDSTSAERVGERGREGERERERERGGGGGVFREKRSSIHRKPQARTLSTRQAVKVNLT